MEGATRSGLMVADEIIARADGPEGLKAQSEKANAGKEESVAASSGKKKLRERIPFFASA